MTTISQTMIQQLPKTDLHCHFDGSIRLTTLIELAKRENIALFSYDPAVLKAHLGYGCIRQSLEEYLFGFEPLLAVLQEADAIEQAFFEVCEDAADENVWYLELRYCPYLHTQKKLNNQEVVQACIRGAKRAEQKYGIRVGHILCGLKQSSPDLVLAVAKLAVQFKENSVVAFDLAGPEKGYSIKTHHEAIAHVKKNHLGITMHAGESTGPQNIQEALLEGLANRIGHGTSLLQDERLAQEVKQREIAIESCPISNLHTQSVKSLAEHPLKAFLDAGICVSINTDNRLVSDTTISKEITAVMQHLGVDQKRLITLLRNGFQSAFLPSEEKRRMLERFDMATKSN